MNEIMSTKIYNGYHLPKLKTVRDVILWWRGLTDKFKPLVIKALAKEVGDTANRAGDVFALLNAGLTEGSTKIGPGKMLQPLVTPRSRNA